MPSLRRSPRAWIGQALALLLIALGAWSMAGSVSGALPPNTPVPVPVFGMQPRAYLPVVLLQARFVTLPPGAVLPSDAECAARIQRRPENKGMNVAYNATPGSHRLADDFFAVGSGDPRANTEIATRVSGNFMGTTDELVQWAACKWGIDEDVVRAQAAIESWWRQPALGDWGTQPDRCPPGHGLGVDDPSGRPDQCPESWGLLQIRYPYQSSAWPGMGDSTAFNVDTAFAVWRACFEGYEWWLNHVERGADYGAGDMWGCVGRYYSGRWHTPAAQDYIGRVQNYQSLKIWEATFFQEP